MLPNIDQTGDPPKPKLKFKQPKLSAKEKAAIHLNRLAIDVYPREEMQKVIDAFCTKYNISKCDGLPYYPKSFKVILNGSILK